jgi:uncharacterized protein (DUF1330 family)
MSAYAISEVEVLDEELANRYRDLAADSIARHGGRYLIRAAQPEVAEGDHDPAVRIVVVEFPSTAQLHRWYTSPDYAEALTIGATALRRKLYFVDGTR